MFERRCGIAYPDGRVTPAPRWTLPCREALISMMHELRDARKCVVFDLSSCWDPKPSARST